MHERAKAAFLWLAISVAIFGLALWYGLSTGRLVLAADSPTHMARFKIGVGTYSINGYTKQDVAPYLSHDRTFLPLRYTAYAVGIGDNSITWDQTTQTAYLARNGTIMAVQVGSPTIRVGARSVTVNSPTELKDGRVMLPIRAVAELFGCQVSWDNNTQTVTISY